MKTWQWLVLAGAAGLGVGAAAGAAGMATAMGSMADWALPTGRDNYWGGKWGSRRPPGLPATARTVGQAGDAKTVVAQAAASISADAAFSAWIWALAKHESGGTLALPATTFNALPTAERGGKPKITAWGCFQFNAPAWRDLGNGIGWLPSGYDRPALPRSLVPADANPWDCDAAVEVAGPTYRYGTLYAAARHEGFSAKTALTLCWLFHAGPAMARAAFRAGEGGARAAVVDGWTGAYDFDHSKRQGEEHWRTAERMASAAV